MGQELLLLEDFDLVLLLDDVAAVLLLVGEVGEFELVADEAALELLREGLVFECLRPDAFLRVAAGQTEWEGAYVGLLDSFLCCRRECYTRRLRSDFINYKL